MLLRRAPLQQLLLSTSLSKTAPQLHFYRFMSTSSPANDSARPRATQEQVQQLGTFSTCEISDALLKLQQPGGGYLPDLELFSEGREGTVVGEAYTVKMVDQRDTAAPKLEGHFVDLTPSGSIMVISSPSHVKSASFGGLLGAGASVKGVKGVVIDGRCRDLAELRGLKLPVFARGHSTLGQSPFTRPSAVQIPLTISPLSPLPNFTPSITTTTWPSIIVHPGDLVLADEDGVVVVPSPIIGEVLQAATEGKEVDEKCRKDILEGKGVKETFAKWRGSTKKH
ncbi:ribonuclease E inhibitor RraA/Dimethylmenaquinone methyltransferase [Leucosporidium creatinivorum]|uniref:Ribonuclease E inhibitor RraA/Dimethylmenaquinone methyltransferase n=1 Tax=Leucosporidium creatinivorum TaxID=106004 RepID=A0A1Y2F766_9BASI|nr:ribonuclease E inhibitor RraA/Dimethylmenaquinone methyltransferase [Leucosporidium creatinivorum]